MGSTGVRYGVCTAVWLTSPWAGSCRHWRGWGRQVAPCPGPLAPVDPSLCPAPQSSSLLIHCRCLACSYMPNKNQPVIHWETDNKGHRHMAAWLETWIQWGGSNGTLRSAPLKGDIVKLIIMDGHAAEQRVLSFDQLGHCPWSMISTTCTQKRLPWTEVNYQQTSY